MSKMAMGFLECAGIGAALYAMDKACKLADVRITGIDTINPKDTSAFIPLTTQVKFEGTVANVEEAAEAARLAALELNEPEAVLVSVIPGPEEGTGRLGAISKISLSKAEVG